MESDAEFVERMRLALDPNDSEYEPWGRLVALARHGAASQWSPHAMSEELREKVARVVSGHCRLPDFQCREIADAAIAAMRQTLRDEAFEEAERTAHEQRCERGTPWDRACLAVAAAIRARKGT